MKRLDVKAKGLWIHLEYDAYIRSRRSALEAFLYIIRLKAVLQVRVAGFLVGYGIAKN